MSAARGVAEGGTVAAVRGAAGRGTAWARGAVKVAARDMAEGSARGAAVDAACGTGRPLPRAGFTRRFAGGFPCGDDGAMRRATWSRLK